MTLRLRPDDSRVQALPDRQRLRRGTTSVMVDLCGACEREMRTEEGVL